MAKNRITIQGRIGKDPELKTVGDETIAEFSLAFTPWSKSKGEGETIWFNVSFWNKNADAVMDFYRKGDLVEVEGVFGLNKWTKDGVEKSAFTILGQSIAEVKISKKTLMDEVAPW
jgi:single-strand DNA-binding protein